jgi:catechol 2,3-dioxygenase-like lactoylglutathione lyase family enzyme
VAVQLNHTIVSASDPATSAAFLADVLGLPAPEPYGPFLVVEAANGVSLDYVGAHDDITPQHYAFLVSEEEFDAIFGRIEERGLDYWADPHKGQPGRINTRDGGRGVYWDDPDGHVLEILTRPYGSGVSA